MKFQISLCFTIGLEKTLRFFMLKLVNKYLAQFFHASLNKRKAANNQEHINVVYLHNKITGECRAFNIRTKIKVQLT